MAFVKTFQNSEIGKIFKLTSNYQTFSDSIFIRVLNSEIEPEPEGNQGAFPDGISSDSFVLIYQLNPEYREKFSIEDLNKYAYHYLEEIGSEVDYSKVYYGKDTNGVYTYINKNEGETYENELLTIDGVECYKVYLGGKAEIVGFEKDPSETGNYKVKIANGFYSPIANQLYLFLTDTIKLVNIVKENNEISGFYYSNETVAATKDFESIDNYNEYAYYISIGNFCSEETIKAPSENSHVFSGGEIDAIITSDTMTEIENFANVVNASLIVLSLNVEKIGNYAFSGSNISGKIEISNALKEIGDYAFYNCPNIKLNLDNEGISHLPTSIERIGDYAFAGHGLKRLNIQECNKIEYFGDGVFAPASNLDTIYLLENHLYGKNLTVPMTVTQTLNGGIYESNTNITVNNTIIPENNSFYGTLNGINFYILLENNIRNSRLSF